MTTRIRALVIGARGQVGSALLECLAKYECAGVDLETGPGCDFALNLEGAVRKPSLLRDLIRATKPTVVINAAGMTNVDECEDDEQRAVLINTKAAEVVAKESYVCGAKSVYFSTEYVFDGVKGPYAETDATAPMSVYGRTKLAGEAAVLAVDPRALVVRTTVVYGPEERGKNFAYQLAASLLGTRPIQVSSDQFSSPTYNRDLARGTILLLQRGAEGIVNVAGPEVMSRLEFACRVARSIGAEHSIIQGVETKDLPQKALRPLNAGLNIDKLRKLLPDFETNGPDQAVDLWLRNQRFKAWP